MSEGTVQQRSGEQSTDPHAGTSDASLEKVRDILFGVQSREIDKRFARIEERLAKEASDLRTEIKNRLDALETYFKGEVESLADRLRGEQGDRVTSVKEVSRELRELDSSFSEKASRLDEQLSKSNRDLREQILDQSKRLSDDLQRRTEELTNSINTHSTELRDEKADRSGLAALFTEMAMRLRNEFKLPSVEVSNDD
jgi:phage host-nuclease inhibitor protein Gam